MKSNLKFFALTAAGLLATMEAAFANLCGTAPLPPCAVPEPGSLPLVIAGLVGAIAVARFFKKK